jgi:histidyl-tRNA synthetase
MEVLAPRGTRDILPDEVGVWRRIEEEARDLLESFGFSEIRTPLFEHTELFVRGIGEATDIVEKEMYTFSDKGGRSLTLRPEGTAPVARAYVEHRMFSFGRVQKLYYIGPMFRYERPQFGRYRQHWQIGGEVLGSDSPSVDAELIFLSSQILKRLGMKDMEIGISSIGCSSCRRDFKTALREYLSRNKQALCGTCIERMERNIMRVLDCKEEGCRAVLQGAPSMLEYLCDDCSRHFEGVRKRLSIMGVDHFIDGHLVRGLDYYTRTVFEISYRIREGKIALVGGGRYDSLIEMLGGPPTPAAGFAMGVDRVVLALGEMRGKDERPSVFVAAVGEGLFDVAFRIAEGIRNGITGISVIIGDEREPLKKQLREASRWGAKLSVIIGPDELRDGSVSIKDMETGDQEKVAMDMVLDRIRRKAKGDEV